MHINGEGVWEGGTGEKKVKLKSCFLFSPILEFRCRLNGYFLHAGGIQPSMKCFQGKKVDFVNASETFAVVQRKQSVCSMDLCEQMEQ